MKPELYDAIKQFHTTLDRFSTISLEELMIAKDIVNIEYFKPGELFLAPGMNSQKVGIIIKGLCKTYYIQDNGKKHISHIGAEGAFIGTYTDMLKKVPSTGFIEILEPTTILSMNYEELLEATKTSLAWAHLLRKVTEDRYIYRSDKDRQFSLKSAKEKYEYFLQAHPDLENRIHQNQIALYLNITAATLSRLKNKTGIYKTKKTDLSWIN